MLVVNMCTLDGRSHDLRARAAPAWLVCLQRASAKTDMNKLQTLVAQSEFAEFTAQGACQCELKWATAVKFCRVDRFLTETAGLRRGSFKLTLGDAAPAALADQKPADGNVAAPGPAVASHSVVAAPGSLVAEGLVSMPPAAASPLLMLKALLRQRRSHHSSALFQVLVWLPLLL